MPRDIFWRTNPFPVVCSPVDCALLHLAHITRTLGWLVCWLTADQTFQNSDFHFDCPPPRPQTGAPPLEQVTTALATVRAAAASAASGLGGGPVGRVQGLLQAAAASSKTGEASSAKQQSLAHIEALLSSALMLGRTTVLTAGGIGACSTNSSNTPAAAGAALAAAQQEYRYARRAHAEDRSLNVWMAVA